jgi:hypothetical protein
MEGAPPGLRTRGLALEFNRAKLPWVMQHGPRAESREPNVNNESKREIEGSLSGI